MDERNSSDYSYPKTDARRTRSDQYADADHYLPPPQKSKRRAWVGIIMGVVLVLVFYLAFRHHDNETQAAAPKGGKKGFGGPVTINTATAKQGDIGRYLTATWTVTPLFTSVNTSHVNEIINTVHYKEA